MGLIGEFMATAPGGGGGTGGIGLMGEAARATTPGGGGGTGGMGLIGDASATPLESGVRDWMGEAIACETNIAKAALIDSEVIERDLFLYIAIRSLVFLCKERLTQNGEHIYHKSNYLYKFERKRHIFAL